MCLWTSETLSYGVGQGWVDEHRAVRLERFGNTSVLSLAGMDALQKVNIDYEGTRKLDLKLRIGYSG